MTMPRRRELARAALTLLAGTGSADYVRSAKAQGAVDYPSRPVTVLVPWAAGGSTDAFARVLAARLGGDLGQPFVVDNRTGASGTIGMAAAARARPDGQTVVIAPNSTYAIAPHLYQLPYDTERAFAAVGLLASMPIVMAVPRASPARTLAEYVELAKRPGAREAWANAGAGATTHVASELLQQMAGIELTDVGYRGGGPAIQGVLAGDAGMIFIPASAVTSLIAAGDLRALAVTTRERSPALPEVPTFAESGYPEYEVVEHLAMFVPAGTPQPIVGKLSRACAAAMRAPEVVERLAALTVVPTPQPPEAWPAYFAAESGRWRELVRARNIRVQ
jgi:tripartite-type tricarboxylate transporter receptor subunit TctC